MSHIYINGGGGGGYSCLIAMQNNERFFFIKLTATFLFFDGCVRVVGGVGVERVRWRGA